MLSRANGNYHYCRYLYYYYYYNYYKRKNIRIIKYFERQSRARGMPFSLTERSPRPDRRASVRHVRVYMTTFFFSTVLRDDPHDVVLRRAHEFLPISRTLHYNIVLYCRRAHNTLNDSSKDGFGSSRKSLEVFGS